MNTDDDDLGIDLDAWQPPPVPGGIADAVVAQMRQEHTSITTVTAVDPERRGSKRAWLVAIPLVAAATAGLVAFGIRRAPPKTGQGTVVAERPMHLALGPSSAELDRGTQVTWRRDRYTITATQTGGAATWRVGDDDTLTIDAAVASIEATNASLRVEVTMIDANQKKTIATSAVTAAAVALVTIVVYEGTVKATADDGKPKQVAAGTTYEIKGKNTVIEEEASLVGAGTPDLIAQIDELDRQIAQKRLELEDRKKLEDQRTVEQEKLELDVQQFDFSNVPASLDRKEIQRVMTALAPKFRACAAGYSGRITVTVNVNPNGTVEGAAVSPSDAAPASCIADTINAAKFAKTKSRTSFKYPLVFAAPPTKTVAQCAYEELLARGKEAYASNNWAAALRGFDAAYQCRAEPHALKLAFAAACGARHIPKARLYWSKMSQGTKDAVLALCIRAGITDEMLSGGGSTTAKLRVLGPPKATVYLDGVEVGTEAVELDVSPGKHKVTFQVGDDRHSFSVLVKAGETARLDKHALQ